EADLGRVLGLIGNAIGADRAFLARSRPDVDGLVLDTTHEWCADGVSSVMATLQEVNASDVPWWIEQLSTRSLLVLNSLDELPPGAEPERALLQANGVRAAAAVPITDSQTRLIGFLGFDYVVEGRRWSDEDVRVLQTT